jgi:hypothetical protein
MLTLPAMLVDAFDVLDELQAQRMRYEDARRKADAKG